MAADFCVYRSNFPVLLPVPWSVMDLKAWSDQWWFPESSWCNPSSTVALSFGRKDVRLIESIMEDLESSKMTMRHQEETLLKMQQHFYAQPKRRGKVAKGRSYLGAGHVLRGHFYAEDLNCSLAAIEKPKKSNEFEITGYQAQLNSITEHYVQSKQIAQKSLIPSRFKMQPNIYRCGEDGSWCVVESRSKPHQNPCDSCQKQRQHKLRKELFRSNIYPWESDEEESPYHYYCPRGRAAIQQKTYSSYNVFHQFRAKYYRLGSIRKRVKKRTIRKKLSMDRRKVFTKSVSIRHKVRKAVKSFKTARRRKMWERTYTKIKLFKIQDPITGSFKSSKSRRMRIPVSIMQNGL